MPRKRKNGRKKAPELHIDLASPPQSSVLDRMMVNQEVSIQKDVQKTPENETQTSEADAVLESEEVVVVAQNSEGDAVLASDEEVLASDEEVLASDEEVLASDEEVVLASDEEVLASDEEVVLASDEEVLASDEEVLASDEEVLASDEEVLASDEEVLASDEEVVLESEAELGGEEELSDEEELGDEEELSGEEPRSDDLLESKKEEIRENDVSSPDPHDTVNLSIDKPKPPAKNYIIMGLTRTSDAERVQRSLGEGIRDYSISLTSIDKIVYFLNHHFPPRYRMPGDSVLTQRLALYTQLFRTGGLFINPAVHPKISSQFTEHIVGFKPGIILLLDKKRTPERCQIAAKRHTIRNGRPERELVLDAQFIMSSKPKHPFWLDVLQLAQRRYNQAVPKGERIDSITKYGRGYLGGADLLSEAYIRYRNKYDDILLLDRPAYASLFT